MVVVLVLGVGGYFGAKSASLSLRGKTAEATVVDLRRGSKGATTPVVEFSTDTGEIVRLEANASTPVHRLGDKLNVHYDPSRPSSAVIDTFREMWLLPVIGGVLGNSGLVAVVALMTVGRRREKARARAKDGLHLPALVVGARAGHVRGRAYFEPIVEAADPQGGAPVRCTGDRQHLSPAIGARAVVHVDAQPPHGYFVEMGG